MALFREEVTKGLAHAVEEVTKNNLDPSLVYFSMWTEAIKHFAEQGKGNVIFLDSSINGMNKTMTEMMGISVMKSGNGIGTSTHS